MLRELTSELFVYLVVFRRKIAAKATIRCEDLANDLRMIFARMDKRAEENPSLDERYRRIRRVLVAAADGVVTGSEWEDALAYRTGHLLENEFYQSNEGGDYFYDELQKLSADQSEEREIFFTSLGLGFQGRLSRQPEARFDEKRKLYRGLPGKLVDNNEKLTPRAYEHTDERDCTVPPVARFSRYAIIVAGILVFLLLLGRVVYLTQKSSIENVVSGLTPEAAAKKGRQ